MSTLFTVLFLAWFCANPPGWREDFSKSDWQKQPPCTNWKFDGGKIAVPDTRFEVKCGVLRVIADKSTGSLMTMPKADLKRYPILHWRWKVCNLPLNADGRDPKRDDQPAALYFGSGGIFSRKVLGFRWENLTPVGEAGKAVYAGGIVTAHHWCVRNKETPVDEFVEEYVNIAELFQKTYGFIPEPDDYVISFGGNSQYTGSCTTAEFDFIELIEAMPPEAEPDKKEEGK